MVAELSHQERALAEAVAVRTLLPVEGVELMASVARIFDVQCIELVGPSRKARLTDARSVIAYVLMQRGWTASMVGELITRDHQTARHLAERIEKDYELKLLTRDLAA